MYEHLNINHQKYVGMVQNYNLIVTAIFFPTLCGSARKRPPVEQPIFTKTDPGRQDFSLYIHEPKNAMFAKAATLWYLTT
jgi:hypothetical protein